MKFSERPAAERVAIDAWIRVAIMVREDGYMKVADGFKASREKMISENPADIEKMVRIYAHYQQGRHPISYTDYFRVSNPEEYAALVLYEKSMPLAGI